MTVRILQGDVRDKLADLPDESVHACVTSPPYWGLRSYGTEPQVWGGNANCAHEWGDVQRTAWANAVKGPRGVEGKNGTAYAMTEKWHGCWCEDCGAWRGELGLEPTYLLYVEHITEIMRQVRRVLRSDGLLWLNLGDCYATGAGRVGSAPGGGDQGNRWAGRPPAGATQAAGYRGTHSKANSGKAAPQIIAMGPMIQPNRMPQPNLKSKDLVGIPWRIAFALQDDGWWLRSDVIWAKPNPMPESVTDRCTKSHEYLFMLAKSEIYHFDADAIKEPAVGKTDHDLTGCGADAPGQTPQSGNRGRASGNRKHKGVTEYENSATEEHRTKAGLLKISEKAYERRNKRSVWTVATEPTPEAHFATFPSALIEDCIKSACPSGGVVLDPFLGSGTTAIVCDRLGRDCIGIELNREYAEMAERRFRADGGMFAEVSSV